MPLFTKKEFPAVGSGESCKIQDGHQDDRQDGRHKLKTAITPLILGLEY